MPSLPRNKKTRQIGMMLADCLTCDATGTVSKEIFDKEIEERRIPTEMIQPRFETDYRELDKQNFKNKMHNANVAYLNQPLNLNKAIQNSPAHDRLTESEINKLKSQVQPREDDMLNAQREAVASEDIETETQTEIKTQTKDKVKSKKRGAK